MTEKNGTIGEKPLRNIAFDIMKGIGILAVIIGHIESGSVAFIYSFHMPLFFIVSGYFYREKTVLASIRTDARHLLLPYALTCMSIIACYAVLSWYHGSNQVSSWLLASLYGSATLSHVSYYGAHIPRIGAIWFLLALFWCKNLFNIIHRYCLHPFRICIVVSVTAALLNRYLVNAPGAILIGFSALIFYYIGYWVRLQGGFTRVNLLLSLLCVMIWVWTILASEMSVACALYGHYPLNIMGAYGGTFMVFLFADVLAADNGLVARFLAWCGRHSLLILCLHLFEMDVPVVRQMLRVPDAYRLPFVIIFCISLGYLFTTVCSLRDRKNNIAAR